MHPIGLSELLLVVMFAVGSIIEDTLEKNREIWLVLQNMRKAYDSVGWYYLRASLMSGRIKNSGGITSHFMAGAFVNNTIWVESYQTLTQYALNIASKFFEINDISINNDKTVTIPINQDVKVASLSICGQPISIAKKGKPSVAKAYSNVCFFVNVVLRKAITNKQFSYLVSTVLQSIKSFKLKACLSHDFSDAALHHPLLYGLKTFKQIQSESKLAAVIFEFADYGLGSYKSFAVLVRLCVSPVNNFLANVVKVFLSNKLSLANNLPNIFHSSGVFLISLVFGDALYFSSVHFLKHFGVVFDDRLLDKKGHKKLDLRGPVLSWFRQTSQFLCNSNTESSGFSVVWSSLHKIWSGSFNVFIDSSLRNFGLVDVSSSAAVYFPAVNLSLEVKIWGLLSSILAKLQAIALALECVLSFCTVVVHTDSQAAINTCVFKMSTAVPDFHVPCWVERHHIFNLVYKKNINVKWMKIRGYSGICGNEKTDAAAGNAMHSQFFLPVGVQEHFLVAEDMVVSDNAWHFSTSRKSSVLRSYLIKAVHRWLPVAVRKRLYDKGYLGVQCLLCGEVELPDHVFLCALDILAKASASWVSLVRACTSSSSTVLQFLDLCSLNIGLYSVVCKGFVMEDWYTEAAGVFNNKKEAVSVVVDYIRHFVELHHSRIWLVRSKHRVDIEKTGLMLGIADSLAISFGHHMFCLFFSRLDCNLHVIIGM
ncbi:hypothetical protein G9A89_021262 [Geosiphon pyriformis]|nr:hypothetical protein G9A89_021262 [Geosiphon pyriformis]